jgi:hypothetical protein
MWTSLFLNFCRWQDNMIRGRKRKENDIWLVPLMCPFLWRIFSIFVVSPLQTWRNRNSGLDMKKITKVKFLDQLFLLFIAIQKIFNRFIRLFPEVESVVICKFFKPILAKCQWFTHIMCAVLTWIDFLRGHWQIVRVGS